MYRHLLFEWFKNCLRSVSLKHNQLLISLACSVSYCGRVLCWEVNQRYQKASVTTTLLLKVVQLNKTSGFMIQAPAQGRIGSQAKFLWQHVQSAFLSTENSMLKTKHKQENGMAFTQLYNPFFIHSHIRGLSILLIT